jgi:hypothetical protein
MGRCQGSAGAPADDPQIASVLEAELFLSNSSNN